MFCTLCTAESFGQTDSLSGWKCTLTQEKNTFYLVFFLFTLVRPIPHYISDTLLVETCWLGDVGTLILNNYTLCKYLKNVEECSTCWASGAIEADSYF